MSNTMTTAVARRMNFAGRGGKVAIQKMKLLRVIIGIAFSFILLMYYTNNNKSGVL